MKKFLVSMAVAALAIPALAQSSAPARVAVIDVNKVLSSSTAGKVAAAKLKDWNLRSLPPDSVVAMSLYQNWLVELSRRTLSKPSVTPSHSM